jgi:hypothetical protein
MTDRIVNERSESINQNKAEEALLQAESLLQIALNCELQNASSDALHDYFWVVSDLISCARKLLR